VLPTQRHGPTSSHSQAAGARARASAWLLRTPHFRRVTSQGGQDGALEYIFHHIGTTNKFFVVRGAAPPQRAAGRSGWQGVCSACRCAAHARRSAATTRTT